LNEEPRWLRRSVKGLRFLSIQSGIQLVSVASGFLLVNQLRPEAFAIFTVATAAFNLLALIADGGVMSAMTALGADVRADPVQSRALINDVVTVRRVLSALGLGAAALLTAVTLGRLGALLTTITALVAVCGVYGVAATAQAVWSVVLRLQGRFDMLQRIEGISALVRLGLVIAVVVAGAGATGAVGSSLLSFLLVSILCWKHGQKYVAPEAPRSLYLERIRPIVRSAFPAVAFFALQGQLTVALMGIFGTSTDVASAGALARVAAVFAPLGPLLTNVVAPRFAILPHGSAPRFLVRWGTLVVLFGVAGTGLSFLAAQPILALLGEPYRHLRDELALCTAAASVGLAETFIGVMNKARAWMKQSWTIFPLTLGLQGMALMFCDVRELRGALIFALAGGTGRLAAGLLQAWWAVRSNAR
jgi:O-antigen/teichoic acid export membrane protein